MCLQCRAKATLIIKEIFPGWQLMKSQVNVQETASVRGWPFQWFGLVRRNDPDYVFPFEGLFIDLTRGMSDKDLDAIRVESVEWESYKKFSQYVQRCRSYFMASPQAGWALVNACIAAGYSVSDGDVVWWVLDRIARRVLQ